MTVGINILEDNTKGKFILRVEGRLDATSSSILENRLVDMMNSNKESILLDFAKVDYMSSAGMRLLISVTKKMKAKHGHLSCFSINDDVMEIIKMAGFEKILSLYPTENEAINAV